MTDHAGRTGSSGFAGRFHESARRGGLLYQCCGSCGAVNPYTVTLLCHRCGSTDLGELTAHGAGEVISCTWVAMPSDSGPPRQVILAELDEGMRVLAMVEPPNETRIGDRVRFLRLDPLSGALVFGSHVEVEGSARQSLPGVEAGAP